MALCVIYALCATCMHECLCACADELLSRAADVRTTAADVGTSAGGQAVEEDQVVYVVTLTASALTGVVALQLCISVCYSVRSPCSFMVNYHS